MYICVYIVYILPYHVYIYIYIYIIYVIPSRGGLLPLCRMANGPGAACRGAWGARTVRATAAAAAGPAGEGGGRGWGEG